MNLYPSHDLSSNLCSLGGDVQVTYEKVITSSKRSFINYVDTSKITLPQVRLFPGRGFETPLINIVMKYALDIQLGKCIHSLVNILEKG